jgi:hypothetical protein
MPACGSHVVPPPHVICAAEQVLPAEKEALWDVQAANERENRVKPTKPSRISSP